MKRRPLKTLDEALVKRKRVRRGWVYIHKTPNGPPAAKTMQEEAIDDLIRDTAVSFDFSPIFSGDRRFAQKVAEDFINEMLEYAEDEDEITSEALEKRVLSMWPWWWRALNTFRNRLHTMIRAI